MKHKVFCLYDVKAEAYLQPFFLRSRGEAVRAFTDLVNDPKTNVNRYPADFTLFELGEYDDANAKFTLHSTPTSMGVGIEYSNANTQVKPVSVTPNVNFDQAVVNSSVC